MQQGGRWPKPAQQWGALVSRVQKGGVIHVHLEDNCWVLASGKALNVRRASCESFEWMLGSILHCSSFLVAYYTRELHAGKRLYLDKPFGLLAGQDGHLELPIDQLVWV